MRIIEVNPDSLTPVQCHRSNQQWRVLGRRAGTRQILMSFIKGVGQNKMWKFISKHLETLLLSIKVGQSVLLQSAGKHHADISSGLAELTSRSPLSLHLTHSASQSIRFFSINDGATASKYSWQRRIDYTKKACDQHIAESKGYYYGILFSLHLCFRDSYCLILSF